MDTQWTRQLQKSAGATGAAENIEVAAVELEVVQAGVQGDLGGRVVA